MRPPKMSRRDHLRFLGTGATALAGSAAGCCPSESSAAFGASPRSAQGERRSASADRIRRMKWWHEARFGMFIHWGLYSRHRPA